ncbi:MAG TPA: hypothetical protein VD928_02210 [Candidatus Paceibacterota bacterium]|nr:hypothetical protein [Candidatus Paceibacterota bacterium]
MFYALILASHISVAVITGIVILFALYAIARGKSHVYRNTALTLALVAALQVISGTLLALLSPDVTAASLSAHIAVYLGVCVIVEALLFIRMRNISLNFPVGLSVFPVMLSVIVFITAIVRGF